MTQTAETIASMTDDGQFELLATAILREANPRYASILHQGVNAFGKTVKSPLDGITFEPGANPPHLLAVHHTTARPSDLRKKWLHNPSKVIARSARGPTAPAGDLVKTALLVADERTRTQNLRATLILTTNHEPDVDLVLDVQAEARRQGMEMDIWSRSRLSHILDSRPYGQWIRRVHLGIEQELLSLELLRHLSKASLTANQPLDNSQAWIPRDLDSTLESESHRRTIFLVAASGMGKSVACYQRLSKHVASGGVGLVVSAQVVREASSLENAISLTLKNLHPKLSDFGPSAASFCTPKQPLIVVVEDVNRSGNALVLAEKITSWDMTAKASNGLISSSVQLLCPLWPDLLAAMGDQARKIIEPLILSSDRFTEKEAVDAITARASEAGRAISQVEAVDLSNALGRDPLLIALHDHKEQSPSPHSVIKHFVDSSLRRSAQQSSQHTATALREALQRLGTEMLRRRALDVSWRLLSFWFHLDDDTKKALIVVAHTGELIRFNGNSEDESLTFRHDRVREWILADAAGALDKNNALDDSILSELYFARIFGTVLAFGEPRHDLHLRLESLNPLSLFYALRFVQPFDHRRAPICAAIDRWLDNPDIRGRAKQRLRWDIMATLSSADAPEVLTIARKLNARSSAAHIAVLRNGDISGGVSLCLGVRPYMRAAWRDTHIQHAKLRYGRKLTEALSELLGRAGLNEGAKVGALRFAGHLADTDLMAAICQLWDTDPNKHQHLADYIWAMAQCCDAATIAALNKPTEAWANLPDGNKPGEHSPRMAISDYHLRFAFHQFPPRSAIDFFICRAKTDERLRWAITYMLHGLDDPRAVVFVTDEIAAIRRSLEGTNGHSSFALTAADVWERRVEDGGSGLSGESKRALEFIWQNSHNDKHRRRQALAFWITTPSPGDPLILQKYSDDKDISDVALQGRLRQGDMTAIPSLVENIRGDNSSYWWQFGRDIWSPDLTEALEVAISQKEDGSEKNSSGSSDDWITSQLICRLPEDEAERILLKYWPLISHSPRYIQAALYVATPALVNVATEALKETTDRNKALEFLSQQFGINEKGHPGVSRKIQLLNLIPYLSHLTDLDHWLIWEVCISQGWKDVGEKLLAAGLKPQDRSRTDPEGIRIRLNDLLRDGRNVWLSHTIERILEEGVQWREFLPLLVQWVDEVNTPRAVEILRGAIGCAGTRNDLGVLSKYHQLISEDLMEDVSYQVYRRSLT